MQPRRKAASAWMVLILILNLNFTALARLFPVQRAAYLRPFT